MIDFIKKIYDEAFTNSHLAGLQAVWDAALQFAKAELPVVEQVGLTVVAAEASPAVAEAVTIAVQAAPEIFEEVVSDPKEASNVQATTVHVDHYAGDAEAAPATPAV